MLTNPSSGRRVTGRLAVLAAVAVALPLTATRAVDYVDVPLPAPAPAAPLAPVAPIAPIAAAAPLAPAAPHPARQLRFDGEGSIHINGQTKRWSELSPEEKAQVREEIRRAKEELRNVRINRGEIEREIQESMRDVQIDKEALRRDLAEARTEIERALREVDAHVVDIRRSGHNPEQIKATIRASLKSVEAIDVEAITRQAMASVDHRAIAASVAAAEESVARAQAEVERLEDQFADDE